MRKSVAHEEVTTWSAKENEGTNVLEELDGGAGREERSPARSNGEDAIEGAGAAL